MVPTHEREVNQLTVRHAILHYRAFHGGSGEVRSRMSLALKAPKRRLSQQVGLPQTETCSPAWLVPRISPRAIFALQT